MKQTEATAATVRLAATKFCSCQSPIVAATASHSAQHRKGQLCGGKAGNPVCSERHAADGLVPDPLALCDGVKRTPTLGLASPRGRPTGVNDERRFISSC